MELLLCDAASRKTGINVNYSHLLFWKFKLPFFAILFTIIMLFYLEIMKLRYDIVQIQFWFENITDQLERS